MAVVWVPVSDEIKAFYRMDKTTTHWGLLCPKCGKSWVVRCNSIGELKQADADFFELHIKYHSHIPEPRPELPPVSIKR